MTLLRGFYATYYQASRLICTVSSYLLMWDIVRRRDAHLQDITPLGLTVCQKFYKQRHQV